MWVGVEHRVQESYGPGLAGCNTLVDDTVDDGRDDGSCSGGATFNDRVATNPDRDDIANSGYVWIAPARSVEETAVFAKNRAVVRWVRRGIFGEVAGSRLVRHESLMMQQTRGRQTWQQRQLDSPGWGRGC